MLQDISANESILMCCCIADLVITSYQLHIYCFTCSITVFDSNEILKLGLRLLGYYITQSGNSIPMFQENLLVPSSRVKSQDIILLEFTDLGDESCLQMSIWNYHSMQCYIPEEHRSDLQHGRSLKSCKFEAIHNQNRDMTVWVRQVQIKMKSIFKYMHIYMELQMCIYEAIRKSNKDIKFKWHRRKNAVSFWILLYIQTHTHTHYVLHTILILELQGRKIIFSFKNAHLSIWHSTNLVLLLTLMASSCLLRTSILKQALFLKYTLTIYIT